MGAAAGAGTTWALAQELGVSLHVPLPAADRFMTIDDGRVIAFDDRGDPAGDVVLFFHGTPDTRLARHPDDSIATAERRRVVALDRPGLGDSTVDPTATPMSVAADHLAVLDYLGVATVDVVAWSAGAIFGLAFAGASPHRVRSVTLIAPLIPADGYADPSVLTGSGDSRRMFADVFPSMTPTETGRELAMWLVPPVIDQATAEDMLAESLARMAAIEGAASAFVAALAGTVAHGMTGLEREIAAQATPLDSLLDSITAPVSIHVGANDDVTPPAMAAWLGQRLAARVTEHPGETHSLGVTGWAAILAALPR